MFNKTFIQTVFLKRYHDDKLTKHLKANKTVKLLARKHYWKNMIKYVWSYVKTYDICQRTKVFRHCFSNELMSLLQFFAFEKKISINFVIEFSFNKILKQNWRFVSDNRESLYKNDFIYFCHEKYKCDQIYWNHW